MAVALGTADGESHPDVHRRVDAIFHGRHAELFVVGSPLRVRHRVAIEGGGHELLVRRPGQQVARQLLDRKLVERRVRVERVDHPIAIEPDRPQRVGGVTGRVGIAGQVEPGTCAPLTERRVGQHSIDETFVGAGIRVADELLDLGRSRRQAAQIETESPNQRVGIGWWRWGQTGRLQLHANKEIDGVGRPFRPSGDCSQSRQLRAHGLLEGPVPGVAGSLTNPLCENSPLIVGERAVGVGGGHPLVGVRGRDAANEFAPVRVAGDDGRFSVRQRFDGVAPQIESQAAFAVLFVRPVAGEAVFRQDGPHIAVEVDRPGRRLSSRVGLCQCGRAQSRHCQERRQYERQEGPAGFHGGSRSGGNRRFHSTESTRQMPVHPARTSGSVALRSVTGCRKVPRLLPGWYSNKQSFMD